MKRFPHLFAALTAVIFATCLTPCCATIPGDFDGDGDVDAADFAQFAGAWRQAHQPGGAADPKFDLGGEGRPGHLGAAICLASFLTWTTPLPADPFAGAIRYAGPPPTPGIVTFDDGGQQRQVTAFPGQVQVVLASPIPASSAAGLFKAAGGTILGQIPGLGSYLVAVTVGQEKAFIQRMRADSRVYLAFPHLANQRNGVGVAVVDQCGGEHGLKVQQVFADRNVTVSSCRDDGTATVVPTWTIYEAEQEIKTRNGAATLINISASYGLTSGADYDTQPAEVQQNVLKGYTYDRMSLLKTVAAFPASYRANLVITLCAGNNHIPIDSVLAELAADPELADVLKNNVLTVGSKGQQFSNYASSTTASFAWVNNSEAADGTSFAAPYALAIIAKVMDQRGVSATEALGVVKAAVAANPDHELVEAQVALLYYKGTFTGEATQTWEDPVWGSRVREIEVDLTEVEVYLWGSGTVVAPYDVDMWCGGTYKSVQAPPPGQSWPPHEDEYPCGGYSDRGVTCTGKIAVSLNSWLEISLTNGVISADLKQLTGTMTVDDGTFDAPIVKPITLTLVKSW